MLRRLKRLRLQNVQSVGISRIIGIRRPTLRNLRRTSGDRPRATSDDKSCGDTHNETIPQNLVFSSNPRRSRYSVSQHFRGVKREFSLPPRPVRPSIFNPSFARRCSHVYRRSTRWYSQRTRVPSLEPPSRRYSLFNANSRTAILYRFYCWKRTAIARSLAPTVSNLSALDACQYYRSILFFIGVARIGVGNVVLVVLVSARFVENRLSRSHPLDFQC